MKLNYYLSVIATIAWINFYVLHAQEKKDLSEILPSFIQKIIADAHNEIDVTTANNTFLRRYFTITRKETVKLINNTPREIIAPAVLGSAAGLSIGLATGGFAALKQFFSKTLTGALVGSTLGFAAGAAMYALNHSYYSSESSTPSVNETNNNASNETVETDLYPKD